MAKLPRGIFGPIIGKLGPLVGATWNGIPYVRSLPRKSEKPLTQGQINNNEKFKFFNEWLSPFHPFVTVGLQNKAKGMTAINAASSLNYNRAIVGVHPELSVDYSKFLWSVGSLPQLMGVQANLIEADVLSLTWLQDDRQQASFDDQVMLLLYSPELKIADGFIGGVHRKDKQHFFQFNPKLIGHHLEVYVSLTSLNRKKIAENQYLGRINPF